jgi:hypothetical protein
LLYVEVRVGWKLVSRADLLTGKTKQGEASQEWKSVIVVKRKRRRLGVAGEAWWN